MSNLIFQGKRVPDVTYNLNHETSITDRISFKTVLSYFKIVINIF